MRSCSCVFGSNKGGLLVVASSCMSNDDGKEWIGKIECMGMK